MKVIQVLEGAARASFDAYWRDKEQRGDIMVFERAPKWEEVAVLVRRAWVRATIASWLYMVRQSDEALTCEDAGTWDFDNPEHVTALVSWVQ